MALFRLGRGCAPNRSRFEEDAMAREQNPTEEVNAFAHQAKEQALAAADTYFNFLKKAIASYPSSGNAFGDSMKGYAERNVAAVHDFVQRLAQAKDFQDALRIQGEPVPSKPNCAGSIWRDRS